MIQDLLTPKNPGPITEWHPSTPERKGSPKGWKKKYEDSVKAGGIYCFGSRDLVNEIEAANMIERSGFETQFPYGTQYDILMRCYLFYEDYPDVHWMPQEEFWWMAAELRWPTIVHPNGRRSGAFIRNPWAEHVIHTFTHYDIIAIAGSGGCGKSQSMAAWSLMCWEYYMGINGDSARVIFASVDENKLKTAFFSHLTNLHRATQDVGTYTGKADVRQSIQLKRPDLPGKTQDNKPRNFSHDDKGIMKGVLLGGVSEERKMSKIDAITGAHNPHFIAIEMDEFQACSTAALDAADNVTLHPRIAKIIVSGNLARKDDPLGATMTPIGGWEVMQDNSCGWLARDRKGRLVRVVRFNNDYSPGIENPEKYWFLPTIAKRDKVYRTPASRKSPGYQRFWKGTFVTELESDTILMPSIITESKADSYPDLDRAYPVLNFGAFDSAPASIDRSILLHCKLVVEANTMRWLLWFYQAISFPKISAATYYGDTAKLISLEMSRRRIDSGNLILDETASTGLSEELVRVGIRSYPMKFQSAASDELIDYSTAKKAKDHCYNVRAEMAALLSGYVYNGQVRGINEDLVENWRDEICSMRWLENTPNGKAKVEEKRDFKTRMGFSPDIFDTMMMAAFMARTRFGLIPGARENQMLYDRHFGAGVIKGHHEIYESDFNSEAESFYTDSLESFQTF